MNNIKTDYLVCARAFYALLFVLTVGPFKVLVTTDARLAMSEMQDTLSTTVTQATGTALSHITSTVKSQGHCIRGEIRSLGDIQREHAAQICEKLQDMKGYYKGQVGVVLIKHMPRVFVTIAGPSYLGSRQPDYDMGLQLVGAHPKPGLLLGSVSC